MATASDLAEHDVIVAKRHHRTMDGKFIPAGATGTIVAVWVPGKVYEGEFGGGDPATAEASDLVKGERVPHTTTP